MDRFIVASIIGFVVFTVAAEYAHRIKESNETFRRRLTFGRSIASRLIDEENMVSHDGG